VGDVLFKDGVDVMTVTGVVDNPYAFEHFKLEATNVDAGVPIMVWRSVGNSHSEFARESALDELAIAAGRDPVDLRRELLGNNPRTLRALELAVERAGWGSTPSEGRARGIACTNYLSHSAQVVEVSQDERQRIHVEKIVFALDCGIIEIGRSADFVIMDRAQHSAGKNILDSVRLGDLPGIGMTIIDGIVRTQRSRNTPPATKVPVIVAH
jgi:hypothetical protein